MQPHRNARTDAGRRTSNLGSVRASHLPDHETKLAGPHRPPKAFRLTQAPKQGAMRCQQLALAAWREHPETCAAVGSSTPACICSRTVPSPVSRPLSPSASPPSNTCFFALFCWCPTKQQVTPKEDFTVDISAEIDVTQHDRVRAPPRPARRGSLYYCRCCAGWRRGQSHCTTATAAPVLEAYLAGFHGLLSSARPSRSRCCLQVVLTSGVLPAPI